MWGEGKGCGERGGVWGEGRGGERGGVRANITFSKFAPKILKMGLILRSPLPSLVAN